MLLHCKKFGVRAREVFFIAVLTFLTLCRLIWKKSDNRMITTLIL